jgi:3-phosphoshikimate 1-carboxyvinyltransferase
MGNAGTAMRLFTGLLAAQPFDSQLIGDASLMKRPMERVAKPLREIGADVRTRQGTPPVDIVGGHRLHGIEYRMPVASAQVKSALLLAALYADGATTVIAPNITRDHSERMLASCGVRLDIAGLRVTVHPPQELTNQRIDVPGISRPPPFHRGGAVGGRTSGLLIENVGLNPTRTGLLDILRSMGGRIELKNPRSSAAEPVGIYWCTRRPCAASGSRELVPLAIDELPVLFTPPPVRRASSVVRGAEELRVKEATGSLP